MNVSTFLKRVNYQLRGTDDDTPDASSEDGEYWLETLNLKKDELFNDLTKEWRFSHVTDITDTRIHVGTIAAATNASFNLDLSFLGAGSYAYVLDTDGHRHNYEVIQPQDADPNEEQKVYVDGQNPEKLNFTRPILDTDPIVGGALYLPGYYMPADVAYAADGFDPDVATIPLPNANWGVAAVASEVAFNDLTYEDKAPDINNKANNLYKLMVKRNQRGTALSPRKVRGGVGTSNGRKIRGY